MDCGVSVTHGTFLDYVIETEGKREKARRVRKPGKKVYLHIKGKNTTSFENILETYLLQANALASEKVDWSEGPDALHILSFTAEADARQTIGVIVQEAKQQFEREQDGPIEVNGNLTLDLDTIEQAFTPFDLAYYETMRLYQTCFNAKNAIGEKELLKVECFKKLNEVRKYMLRTWKTKAEKRLIMKWYQDELKMITGLPSDENVKAMVAARNKNLISCPTSETIIRDAMREALGNYLDGNSYANPSTNLIEIHDRASRTTREIMELQAKIDVLSQRLSDPYVNLT